MRPLPEPDREAVLHVTNVLRTEASRSVRLGRMWETLADAIDRDVLDMSDREAARVAALECPTVPSAS